MSCELGGHEVRTASGGLAALDVAEDFVADVAFIDLGLPGLDGYEVVRRLRQHPSAGGTVFIALSGYGREEDKRRSEEVGFDHHLTKPVDPREIDTLLAQLTTASPIAPPERLRSLH